LHTPTAVTILIWPFFFAQALMTASARRVLLPSVANAAPPSSASAAPKSTSTRTNLDCMNTPLGSVFVLPPRVAAARPAHQGA
jgi:hypothetical protein